MAAIEWVLVILPMIPALAVCWALFKSGELQTAIARWRVLRPEARRHLWITFLVGTVVAAVIAWAFVTRHAVLGIAILVGCVVLNGIVLPILQARRIQHEPASTSSETKQSR